MEDFVGLLVFLFFLGAIIGYSFFKRSAKWKTPINVLVLVRVLEQYESIVGFEIDLAIDSKGSGLLYGLSEDGEPFLVFTFETVEELMDNLMKVVNE